MSAASSGTYPVLLSVAKRVTLAPPKNKAVFYADRVGASRAADFIRKHPDHFRLDDLLKLTPMGTCLFAAISNKDRNWSEVEGVWIELSFRLAGEAAGDVRCFGPDRLTRDEPLENFRHPYTRGAFAHTQFERIEYPVLATNPRVDRIWMNGKLYH